jgi:hypothetical protein
VRGDRERYEGVGGFEALIGLGRPARRGSSAGIPVEAPADGTVAEVRVREGAVVQEGA